MGAHGEPLMFGIWNTIATTGYNGKRKRSRCIGYIYRSELLFSDGETYSLRSPHYQLTNPYMALPSNVMISPRMAPPVFGLGLLEAVDESTILTYADENDANGDGISGKPNYVWDVLSNTLNWSLWLESK